MPFPVAASPSSPELFEVHDPWGLRSCVAPFFGAPTDGSEFIGLGTTFAIHPFGYMLTAAHVIEPLFEQLGAKLKSQQSKARFGILANPGLVMGAPGPSGDFLAVDEFVYWPKTGEDPAKICKLASSLLKMDFAFDLARFQGPEAQKLHNYLGIDLTFTQKLKVGDKLMAVGFPTIAASIANKQPDGSYVSEFDEELAASVGTVTEIAPNGYGQFDWPSLITDVAVPSGFSGGPVFSESGNVVGLVSGSWKDEPQGSSFLWLQPLREILEGAWKALDLDNPGWVKGWGVLKKDRVLSLHPSQEKAEAAAGGAEVAPIATGSEHEFIFLEPHELDD